MTLGFILLGLLSIKPMTGYDLKGFFDKSINFFWTAELSQIYKELSKLEAKGYISFEVLPQQGKPDKKVYSINGSGEQAFVDWLRDFPHNLTPISRNEFLVRMFFSAKISKEETMLQLSRYIRQQEQDLVTFQQIEEKLTNLIENDKENKEYKYRRFTVRRGIQFTQTEINWAKECIEELQEM